jgi:hypothetical protein
VRPPAGEGHRPAGGEERHQLPLGGHDTIGNIAACFQNPKDFWFCYTIQFAEKPAIFRNPAVLYRYSWQKSPILFHTASKKHQKRLDVGRSYRNRVKCYTFDAISLDGDFHGLEAGE